MQLVNTLLLICFCGYGTDPQSLKHEFDVLLGLHPRQSLKTGRQTHMHGKVEECGVYQPNLVICEHKFVLTIYVGEVYFSLPHNLVDINIFLLFPLCQLYRVAKKRLKF